MANLLSELLTAEEPLFGMAIKNLEGAAGRPGQDVRLMSDIMQRTQAAFAVLGLDPRDTTGEELYQALAGKIRLHDEHLSRHLGCDKPGDVGMLLPLIKQAAEGADIPHTAWVLKRSSAKQLLQAMPPKNVMKHLGYTSVESMTKRENIAELFAAVRFAESKAWLRRFNKSYKSLTPSDFETRDIEVVVLSRERWAELAEEFIRTRRHNVTHLKELGIVALLPLRFNDLPGLAIMVLPMALHYVNEIRLYSTFFKLRQVSPKFGHIVADVINGDIASAAVMSGTHVHWRVIQRYYGQAGSSSHPELFEPHVQPEDLLWHKTEAQLERIDPELRFWHGLEYVGVAVGMPVSLNLLDVALNYASQAPYKQRSVRHMQDNLWNELFMRYMGHEALEHQILRQLDGSVVDPEKLRV